MCRIGADEQVDHSVLGAHRRVPRLVDGGTGHADGTGRVALMCGPQPSFREAGARVVFSVHTGDGKDKRQLPDIRQRIDIGVVEAGRHPHLHVAVTAIADDAHTAVHRGAHHRRCRVAGSVQTALAALK